MVGKNHESGLEITQCWWHNNAIMTHECPNLELTKHGRVFQEPIDSCTTIQIILLIQYANLLPARKDGDIILPPKMAYESSLGVSYQPATSW